MSSPTSSARSSGLSTAYGRAAADDPRPRRDLAIQGFLDLRRNGRKAVGDFHLAASRLIAPSLDALEDRWRAGALAAAEETRGHLAGLRRGDLSHLREARVRKGGPEARMGMCGHLDAYPVD